MSESGSGNTYVSQFVEWVNYHSANEQSLTAFWSLFFVAYILALVMFHSGIGYEKKSMAELATQATQPEMATYIGNYLLDFAFSFLEILIKTPTFFLYSVYILVFYLHNDVGKFWISFIHDDSRMPFDDLSSQEADMLRNPFPWFDYSRMIQWAGFAASMFDFYVYNGTKLYFESLLGKDNSWAKWSAVCFSLVAGVAWFFGLRPAIITVCNLFFLTFTVFPRIFAWKQNLLYAEDVHPRYAQIFSSMGGSIVTQFLPLASKTQQPPPPTIYTQLRDTFLGRYTLWSWLFVGVELAAMAVMYAYVIMFGRAENHDATNIARGMFFYTIVMAALFVLLLPLLGRLLMSNSLFFPTIGLFSAAALISAFVYMHMHELYMKKRAKDTREDSATERKHKRRFDDAVVILSIILFIANFYLLIPGVNFPNDGRAGGASPTDFAATVILILLLVSIVAVMFYFGYHVKRSVQARAEKSSSLSS